MEAIAITSKGIEETAALEINETIGSKCKTEEKCVSFDFKKFEDLCLLCYKGQSVDRIVYLIGSFEFKNFFDEVKSFIEKSKLESWILKSKSFRVECTREGTHDFNSADVESKVSAIIEKKSGIKLDTKNCNIIFFVYVVDNKCYFGIDFAGFELNKRGYKIFLHPASIRGTIAYTVIRESGYKKNETILDCFSRDGIIPIEAAFYSSGFAVNYFKKDKFAFTKLELGIDFEKFFKAIDKKTSDKCEIYAHDNLFKFVDYSRKNAKIAGVDKLINFSRTELEWLDIKFKENTVDRIVTSIPSSKNPNLEKMYKEFFYQAEYILKKNGTVSLVTSIPDILKKFALENKFKILKEKEINSGEQVLNILVFGKGK